MNEDFAMSKINKDPEQEAAKTPSSTAQAEGAGMVTGAITAHIKLSLRGPGKRGTIAPSHATQPRPTRKCEYTHSTIYTKYTKRQIPHPPHPKQFDEVLLLPLVRVCAGLRSWAVA